MDNKHKFMNFFLWMSVGLFVLGGFGSYLAVSEIYGSSFPYNSEPITWRDEYKIEVTCASLWDYEVPVFGDHFSCNATAVDLNLSDKYPIKNTAKNVKALTLHYPKSEITEEPEWKPVGSEDINSSENSVTIYGIKVPVEPGFNEFQLEFSLIYHNEENGALDKFYYSSFIRYEAISLGEYNRRNGEKYTLFLTMVALFIIFSFTGVKNLMDIWDRKR